MSCEYCHENRTIHEGENYISYIYDDEMNIDLEIETITGLLIENLDFKINYCPMCGQKL